MSLYGGIQVTGKPDYENIRKLDLLAVPTFAEMMQYGFAIDKEYLRGLGDELGVKIAELRKEVCSYIPPDKLDDFIDKSNDDDLPLNVDSTQQLGKLLFDTLGIGRGRKLKYTKSGDRVSTGKKQLELLKNEHEVVRVVLNYREHAKLKSTYADALPELARYHNQGHCWCGLRHKVDSWRVHTTLLTTRTGTGRLASKNPNLQNISARSELGRRIRAGFVAVPGTVLVGCDWSQMEVRLATNYSNDPNLIRIFKNKLDPHTDTAKRAFKVDKPDKLTQRDPCKNVTFGVIYGLGPPGLYDLMAVTYAVAGIEMPEWLTVQWCEEFIKLWFSLYPRVKEFLEDQEYKAYKYGMAWTALGRVRLIPEVYSAHEWIREAGIRQAGNHSIQGLCADLMRLVLPEIQDYVYMFRHNGVHCQPLITVHDEGIWEVAEDYADTFRAVVEDTFRCVLVDKDIGVEYSRVPLEADAKIMDRWKK